MKEKKFPLNGHEILMRTQLHDRYLAIDAEYATARADNGLPYTNPMLSRKHRLMGSVVSIKKDDKEYAGSMPDVEAWFKANVHEDEWNFLYVLYDWIIAPNPELIDILKTLEPGDQTSTRTR